MPDDLRPEPARPRLSPPPGGFAAAVQGARAKRRRRAAAALGACASVLVLIGAGLSVSDGDPDSLHPVGPDVTATGSATPGLPLRPSSVTSAAASADSSSSGSPGPARSAPVPAATPSSRPSARATPTAMATASDMRRTVVGFTASDCDHTDVEPTGQWCQRYSGPSGARAGVPVVLSVDICRTGAAGTATFTSTKQADLYIYSRDSRATHQWRWSTGRRFVARREVVTVQGGTCLRFSTTWSTRTDRGGIIAPGDYTIRSQIDAQLSGSAGTGFGVSRERMFTVSR